MSDLERGKNCGCDGDCANPYTGCGLSRDAHLKKDAEREAKMLDTAHGGERGSVVIDERKVVQ